MSIPKMVTVLAVALGVLGLFQGVATAFVHPSRSVPTQKRSQRLALLQASSKDDDPTPPIGGTSSRSSTGTTTTAPPKSSKQDDLDSFLGEKTFGGYTVKQRLREEVESPFRKVRFALFAGSTGSALVACYFSALNTIKAVAGGYADAMPLEEALTSDAINVGALILCGYLAYREYQTGEANLARISRGGKLASLVVQPAASASALDQVTKGTTTTRRRLVDYRRNSRVLIAAGGKEYISKLALSLTSDQLSDSNSIAERLVATDVIVVPVLLVSEGRNGKVVVGDTRECWNSQVEAGPTDRNFDIDRANSVVAFPRGHPQWTEYLASEIDTAAGQGFDVLTKGITLTVKKNGRILRRSTGLPPWPELIGTMEVLDGSRFGMPGDTEKYGGD
jgi:hypothetical protein